MAIGTVKTENRYKQNIKTSAAVGAVAAGIQAVFLPKEAKAVVKMAIKGEDSFIKKAQTDTQFILKEFGINIDGTEIKETAKELFKDIEGSAKQVTKYIAGTFTAAAAGVFVGKMIIDKYLNPKQSRSSSQDFSDRN